jgi:hypothetical protein
MKVKSKLPLILGTSLGIFAAGWLVAAIKKDKSLINSIFCKQTRGCDLQFIPESDPRRYVYDKAILEASNKFGLPPAFLKAQIHAETSFISSHLENQRERRLYTRFKDRLSPYLKSYKWGKGLGQFGANNAHLYGLAWDSKDIGKRVKIQLFGIPAEVELRDIFDPEASIEAKAMYLRELMDGNFMFKLPNPPASPHLRPKHTSRGGWVHALSELGSPTEYYRMLAAAYNRGPNRVTEAAKQFYLAHGRLPKSYAELGTQTFFRGYPITKCHVARIAGICGELSGYMSHYATDFVYAPDKGIYETIAMASLDRQFLEEELTPGAYQKRLMALSQQAPSHLRQVILARVTILNQWHHLFDGLKTLPPASWMRAFDTTLQRAQVRIGPLPAPEREIHLRSSSLILSSLLKQALRHPGFLPDTLHPAKTLQMLLLAEGWQRGSQFQDLIAFMEAHPGNLAKQAYQSWRPLALQYFDADPRPSGEPAVTRALSSEEESLYGKFLRFERLYAKPLEAP